MTINKLQEIDTRVKNYADDRSKLRDIITALTDAIDALKKDHLPRVRRQLNRVAELEAGVRDLLADSPEHFQKPKTLVMHGVKVGFGKGIGTVSFDDEDQVVALIQKKLPELADVLIKTTKKPLKKPLGQLTVAQLKSIGCSVEETGDVVIVKAVDGEVDKLVNALLKGAALEAEEA
jgi:Bacteriophage Mu Gam like protein